MVALPGVGDFGPNFFDFVLGSAKEPIGAFTRVALPTPSGIGNSLPGAPSLGPSLPGLQTGAGPGVSLPGAADPGISRMFPAVGDLFAQSAKDIGAVRQKQQQLATGGQAPLGSGAGYAKNVVAFTNEINQVANEMGIPARVLASLVDVENHDLDPRIVRPDTGAAGLMQVVGGPVEPVENLRAGARLLRQKQQAWGIDPNDWESTAAAYFGAYHNGQVTDAKDATGTTGTAYVQKFRDAYGRYPDQLNAITSSQPTAAQRAIVTGDAPMSGTQDPQKVIAFGRGEEGKPYSGPIVGQPDSARWGTPGYDCSSFVSSVFSKVGVKLSPFTDSIAKETAYVGNTLNQAQPGDIILYHYRDSSQPGVQYPHVAIYIGGGNVLDASYGKGVSEHPIMNQPFEVHRAG
jgi:cell wall-associated NlpC family hydrolase